MLYIYTGRVSLGGEESCVAVDMRLGVSSVSKEVTVVMLLSTAGREGFALGGGSGVNGEE